MNTISLIQGENPQTPDKRTIRTRLKRFGPIEKSTTKPLHPPLRELDIQKCAGFTPYRIYKHFISYLNPIIPIVI